MPSQDNWRQSHNILVVDAHSIGSLAVVRSLGRAGYRVVAASPRADAISFRSELHSRSHIWPTEGDRSEEAFFVSLDRLLVAEQVALIIPSESFLLRLRPKYDRYAHLLPLPANPNIVYRSFSKWDLFETCQRSGLTENLPPFLLIDTTRDLPQTSELYSLPLPIFLKADALYARSSDGGCVVSCATHTAAREKIEALSERYSKILAQGFVAGIGVGAFLASWQHRTLGEFMHRRIHEVPHTGGASSFRRSWFNREILEDARARSTLMDWSGVGMFEYRWNPNDERFYLMEFNSRFWGSLHLALYAGVDFPRLIADAFFGHASDPVTRYKSIASRFTFPAEVGYVVSCLKDVNLPWPRRLWPIAEFAFLCIDPRVRSDLAFPGDRKILWRMLARTVRHFLS